MIAALLALVCAVIVLAWLVALVGVVATIAGGFAFLVSRGRDPSGGLAEDEESGAPRNRVRESDAEFLREVGIKP